MIKVSQVSLFLQSQNEQPSSLIEVKPSPSAPPDSFSTMNYIQNFYIILLFVLPVISITYFSIYLRELIKKLSESG
ncbi:hypothetical protein WA1_12415 [Scytonema hofmannii PCC 7110]|uniref:Uncharacterized protein n=1 Tax=Scytonema hofmannii PCC 7110 TaxID=128403 RepID=A0A139XDZ0_9CYAN|nr:hypothetical protein WA1_12415 [Scytonema hofmannii PCC 7110]